MQIRADFTQAELRDLAANAVAGALRARLTAEALLVTSQQALSKAEEKLAMMRPLTRGRELGWFPAGHLPRLQSADGATPVVGD